MDRVEVVYSAVARQVQTVILTLPAGSTVHDAIEASGLLQRHGLALEAVQCGVWGRRCEPTRAVRDGDRIELYRALAVDPKQARRLRYSSQRKIKRPAAARR